MAGAMLIGLATMLSFASASLAASAEAQTRAFPATAGTEAHNRQIVEKAFARWASGGAGVFDTLLVNDVVWTIKGSGPSAGTFRGRDEFVARAVRPFLIRLREPVRPVTTRVWADGNHVIVNWDGAGIARDGAAYRNSYVWIFRMTGGKVVEATAFLDLIPYDDVLRRVPLPRASDDQR